MPSTPTCSPSTPTSSPPPPSGSAIYVTPSNAQSALNAARDGQTIVFRNGTYRNLRLTNSDAGGGTITLRAENPVLQSIDAQAGVATGLNGGGAVMSDLVVKSHNGLVLDGFKFTGGGRGVSLDRTSNVRVTRSHFHELGFAGIVVDGSSGSLTFDQNYFTNERAAGAGWYMDYGLYVSARSNITFTRNFVDGKFNQAVSLKRLVNNALIADNYLRCKDSHCVVLGQEADAYSGGWQDHTVGSATVRGNIFADNGFAAVNIWNVQNAVVENNTLQNVSLAFYIRYPKASQPGFSSIGFTGPRHPNSAIIRNNSLRNIFNISIHGRGIAGDQIRFENNSVGGTGVRRCTISGLLDAGVLANEQTTARPNVTISNSGFSCSYQ